MMTRVGTAPTLRSVTASMLLIGAVLMAGAGVATAHDGDHHHSRHMVVYVSPFAKPGNSGRSCSRARYPTIQAGVEAAPAWGLVEVCRGTYVEDVVVAKPLSLRGHRAVISGSPTANAMCDQLGPAGPGSAPCLAGLTIKSSHVHVEGFTVQNAIGEGILATGSLAGGSISDVKVLHNKVVGNNTGGIPPTPSSPYPQCSAFGEVPGDCGEGIHLMGVARSLVAGNYVSGNEGGVLLTDEFGPTHDNHIEGNLITRNVFDCGITVPGHNPFALDANGNRQPAVAGVYRNVIRHNRVTFNGLQGEGAGVLFANAGPGTGSYDNLVEDNYLAGNELSGVTMHAHTLAPGQFEDLSGNKIVDNVIGQNNVGSAVAGPGDSLDGPPATDPFTTGILVFSGSVPLHVQIEDNRIFDNHYGVWKGINGNVHAVLDDNSFHHVDIKVFTYS